MITTFPGFFATTFPSLYTVAIFLFEDFQTIFFFVSLVVNLLTFKLTVFPTYVIADFLLRLIFFDVAAFTSLNGKIITNATRIINNLLNLFINSSLQMQIGHLLLARLRYSQNLNNQSKMPYFISEYFNYLLFGNFYTFYFTPSTIIFLSRRGFIIGAHSYIIFLA